MSIIKKNPNEVNYVGGKKHIVDIIKNSGSGDDILWRQPEEDFNTQSTLIVMPGEQALFVNQGKIEEVFQNGTYKLSTQNYPFISRLRTTFSGGISSFNCVVYFVRSAHSQEIYWGTATPFQVRDKLLGIATDIRAYGSYKIQIVDASVFLSKMIGNNVHSMTKDDMDRYFSNQFQSKIKTVITKALNDQEIELLGIESRLEELSEIIEPDIDQALNEYGIRCEKFSIASMNIADDELRRRYDEIGMERIAKLRNAQADKGVMEILGQDWDRQQQIEILKKLADNPGSGSLGAVGAGIGMGLGTVPAFEQMMEKTFLNKAEKEESKSDPVERLKKLKELADSDLITPEEYEEKRKQILDGM